MARSGPFATAVAVLALTACTATVAGTGSPDVAATTTTNAACPGETVATRGLTDAAAVGAAIPDSTPRNLSARDDRTGPQSLEQLVSGYDEPERTAVHRALRAGGFRDGYQRTWTSGTAGTPDRKVEVVVVYRFADPAGACRFRADQLSRSKLTPITVPDVPGAVGVADVAGDIRTSIAVATKGAFLVETEALAYSSPVELWTSDLLKATYGAL